MHRGLPCSRGKLGSTVLDVCYPTSSSGLASFSCGKPPVVGSGERVWEQAPAAIGERWS
jgi:hypothetical protein